MSNSEAIRTVLYLKKMWDGLFYKPHTNDAVFNNLVATYEDERRPYHNINHVAKMFELMKLLKLNMPTSQENQALRLAIFYHDSFPLEKDSSDYMLQSLTRVPGIRCDIHDVERLILSTKDHGETTDKPTMTLSDLDLSILGSLPADYTRYADAIAREYVPKLGEEEYKKGRCEFLTDMICRERIFYLDRLRDAREDLARFNMREELCELRGEYK